MPPNHTPGEGRGEGRGGEADPKASDVDVDLSRPLHFSLQLSTLFL